MLVLGLAIPRYVRSCTERKEAQMREIAKNQMEYAEKIGITSIALSISHDGDYAVAKAKIQVPGRYEVEETGWSWAYDSEQASITQDISEENGNVFTFNNAPKETAPLHDEKYKVNKIVGNN